MMERAFYSVKEFCERNAISKAWFYVLVNREELWIVKAGRKTLVPIACEQAWHKRLDLTHTPTHPAGVDAGGFVKTPVDKDIALVTGNK